MAVPFTKKVLISCLAITTVVALAGCGAGSKTAEKTATKVACDFTNLSARRASTISTCACPGAQHEAHSTGARTRTRLRGS